MSTEIVLLYSRNCKLCRELFSKLAIDWDKYFKMVSVDNKIVRGVITGEKSNIKVNKVPCLLVPKKDGFLLKYEGPVVKEWILTNILKGKDNKDNKDKQSSKETEKETSRSEGVTPIVMPDEDEKPVPRSRNESKKEVKKTVRFSSEATPSESKKVKSKGGNLNRGLEISEEMKGIKMGTLLDLGDDEEVIEHKGPGIRKGAGHEKMAKSSVADTTDELPPRSGSQGMKSILQIASEMKEDRDMADKEGKPELD